MASVILANPVASGAQLVISGIVWSGLRGGPVGGVQFFWVPPSGTVANCYIYLSGAGIPASSGGPTITSGAMGLSGGSLSGGMDGLLIPPNIPVFLPKICFPTGNMNSGQSSICAFADQAASGVGRLFYEVF